MPSSWIQSRATRSGATRYHVKYRLGGRESRALHGGAFATKREAVARKRVIDGEIAALRAPDIASLGDEQHGLKLKEAADRWRESRLDVREATRTFHRTSLNRVLPHLPSARLGEVTADQVATVVVALKDGGAAPATIKKSISVLAQVFDHHGIDPNPARDRRVKLPRNERPEISPPPAHDVEAVLGAVAPRYRLPIMILDATGMRVGELEALTWGDIDETNKRWRVTKAASKTRAARWVQVPADLFAAVLDLTPREDRDLSGKLLPGFGQARLRTEIARSCKATGTPLFSPHDLRHRRISLWHRDGVPWAEIGQRVGQRDLATTANTYTHVLVEGEVARSTVSF